MPAPELSAQLSEAIRREFPSSEVAEVEALLREYGVESYEREVERIRLDIVSIAGGRLAKVAELVKMAKYDYRDLIVAAEYESIGGKLCRKARPKQ